jgi:CRISPR-associated protein Csc2
MKLMNERRMTMNRLEKYLADVNRLTQESQGEKKAYIHPALKNLGSVSLIIIREVIAPLIIRNAEEEVTDIAFDNEVYVRAVPNKFKYPERSRGLQILRAYSIGGRFPQNKIQLGKSDKISTAFDLNTLVLGDSTTHGGNVLAVKAAVNYSDALSLLPKHLCVEQSFHHRGFEHGTLFDAEDKKNSDNLFNRHFIKPGTLLVQVLSTRGKLLPLIGLKHLCLSVGLAGAYGGQTSITGTNIRTHFAGIYADRFEQALTSPYELIKRLKNQSEASLSNPSAVIAELHELLQGVHEISISSNEVQDWVLSIIDAFERDDADLKIEYQQAAGKVAELYDSWFGKAK